MTIRLICIGKTKQPFISEGEQFYAKRLTHYIRYEMVELPDLKQAKNLSLQEIKQAEGKRIMEQLEANDVVVLLDERGASYRSTSFSEFLQQQMNKGLKRLVFVVGGAYGFSEELYKRSQYKLSLSQMTFSHEMVRLFFIEQVYRAMTILKGEPYHHE